MTTPTQIRGSTQIMPNSVTSGQVDSSIIVAGGGNAFTGPQSHGGFKITSLADPTNPQDAATKNYVDLTSQGLSQKPTARLTAVGALAACTYANGTAGVGATLTGNANNTQLTIDSVTIAANDVVLIQGQASAFQNGLYNVTQIATAGLPFIFTRNLDMDQATEFNGAFIPVGNAGSTEANTLWLCNFVSSFVVGTSSVTFTQLNSATSYTGSNGISVAGTVISPTYGTLVNTITQGNDSRLSDARTPVGTALTSANVFVGNGSNLVACVALSGDLSITNAGVATVANQVKLSKYITRETPGGTPPNGSNTVYTLANTPVSGSECVHLNGILQESGGADYSIVTNTITFVSAPITNDRIRVNYISQ